MREVKLRLEAIDRILGAKKPRTLNAELDDEFMWLQLRQIVELVTFSAMLADEERYAALRRVQGDGDYQQDWRATKILPKLASITPHHLPQALGHMVELSRGVKEFQGGDQKATLERFVSLHTAASETCIRRTPRTSMDYSTRLLDGCTRESASRRSPPTSRQCSGNTTRSGWNGVKAECPPSRQTRCRSG